MNNTNIASLPLDKGERHIPGEGAIWALIFGDLASFAVFFGKYFWDRADQVTIFDNSQSLLNINFGAFNTLLLLTASLFVVLGVHAVKSGVGRKASRLFLWAQLCGVWFLVDKVLEYSHKAREGLTPLSNDFFTFYYMFTGFHAFHLLIGLGFLWQMRRIAERTGHSDRDIRFIEVGASFWHLVDLLWIIIFPVLYIIH